MMGIDRSRLPNFFILGVAKCGTTTLHHILSQHPEIFMTRNKEPQFYDNERGYSRGYRDYLNTNFVGSEGYRIKGESTPGYFNRPDVVAPRMLRDLDVDSLKFIVLVRDPVERAYSHYKHRHGIATERNSFAKALELEPELLAKDPELWVGYFHDGLYGRAALKWFRYFDREKFLFILNEDFAKNERDVVSRICNHLDVNPEFRWKRQRRLNKGGMPRSGFIMELMSNPPHFLKWLVKAFANERSMRKLILFRQRLRRLNIRKTVTQDLDEKLSIKLRRMYYNDTLLFESLTGLDLSSWYSGVTIRDKIEGDSCG